MSKSKNVFLTITSKNGEKKTRPMTNYNDSPYEDMWFPSFKDTRKVKDIESNSKVTISFPADEENTLYKVEGIARFAS